MKVLHINCNYAGTALHQTMVEHLDSLGINSTVFVPVYSEKNTVIKPNGNVIISECFKKSDRYIFYHKQAKIRKKLEQSINVKQFDCIHAYTLFTDGNTAYKMSQKYNIPYVVAVRDTDVNAFFKIRKFLRKRGIDILKNASAVFFLSEAYKETVLDKYVPKKEKASVLEKSYVIPNGVDDFWINNTFEERDNKHRIQEMAAHKLRVAYVGAISRRKNISTTIKALHLLKDEGWQVQFTVAGKKQNEQEFSAMNKFPEVNYLGELKKENIITCYRENDVFIMPSRTETFGLVYAEAMTQGLPVIYSKGQGFDGQFEDGFAGYAVNHDDEKQIAQAVKKIVCNYENISRNCLQAADKFCWKDICKKYVDIYHKIVHLNGFDGGE